MPVTPNSAVTPQTFSAGRAIATTANANYVTPTNTATLVATGANPNGFRISKIVANNLSAAGAVTAVECQLYSSDATGTPKYLVDRVTMAAGTVSGTAALFPTFFANVSESTPYILPAGHQLFVANGATVANGISYEAFGYSL
jgi:hypothetical protein